jgi:hypothetical protein
VVIKHWLAFSFIFYDKSMLYFFESQRFDKTTVGLLGWGKNVWDDFIDGGRWAKKYGSGAHKSSWFDGDFQVGG